MAVLELEEWGEGEPAVLVHGCILDGPSTWSRQRPLADTGRHQLRVVQRRGYGSSPPSKGDDFLLDGQDLSQELDVPSHVVGHSYGAMGALIAADAVPERVRSLVLVEPPAYSAAIGEPEVDASVLAFADWWRDPPAEPSAFLNGWADHFGVALSVPDPILSRMEVSIDLLRHCRVPWEAEVVWDKLKAADFPKMVISGGHSPLLELICDRLAQRIGADRHALSGKGHLVPQVGEPFNAVLANLWADGAAGSSHTTGA